MSKDAKKYVDRMLNEMVYQPDLEGDDLASEYAKHIITKYLQMALEEGVKELGEELPTDADGEGGPAELVQDVLDQLVPKLQNFVAAGNLPVR